MINGIVVMAALVMYENKYKLQEIERLTFITVMLFRLMTFFRADVSVVYTLWLMFLYRWLVDIR